MKGIDATAKQAIVCPQLLEHVAADNPIAESVTELALYLRGGAAGNFGEAGELEIGILSATLRDRVADALRRP